MQFIDLKKQYETIQTTIQQRINTVLEHGKFIMGPEITELEECLAAYTGCRYCVSCSSGTDALLLSLMVHGIGPGDAIFTTPFTFIATAEVICLLGATPIFVDIDSRTFNIDPAKLKTAVEDLSDDKPYAPGVPKNLRPKGIIAVDIFGLPADYDAIKEITQVHELFLIEDAAQSFGGVYKGKMACSLADISATSFFPAKPLGCYGDGGAVFTDDPVLAERVISLRLHGQGSHKYDNVCIGLNGRLDTIQAAILLAKLDVFNEEVKNRQVVAKRYNNRLADIVTVPYIPENYQSVWAQYSVMSDHKSQLMQKLKNAGIPTAVYYPKPLHLQTAFSFLGYSEGSLPISEKISKDIFSLPMHPYLEEEDQNRIIEALLDK